MGKLHETIADDLRIPEVESYYDEHQQRLIEDICQTITELKLADYKALHKLGTPLRAKGIYFRFHHYDKARMEFYCRNPEYVGGYIMWVCQKPVEKLGELLAEANKSMEEMQQTPSEPRAPWMGSTRCKLLETLNSTSMKTEDIPSYLENVAEALEVWAKDLKTEAKKRKEKTK